MNNIEVISQVFHELTEFLSENFSCLFGWFSVSRLALEPTQPPVQLVPKVLSTELKRGQGMMLTTHPHLVPRS
jgi:hypothetical protein